MWLFYTWRRVYSRFSESTTTLPRILSVTDVPVATGRDFITASAYKQDLGLFWAVNAETDTLTHTKNSSFPTFNF